MSSGEIEDEKGEPSPAAPAVSRDSITHTSIRSVRSTRITNGGSSASVHSTQSVDVISSDDEMMAIQSSIEQVAASQNNSHTTRTRTRTRAGFNSITDTLGNLRSRLHHARQAQSERHRSSNNRSTWIQRLSDRLNVVDAAHSSRVPLNVMERRRTSVPNLTYTRGNSNGNEEQEPRPSSAASAPPLRAPATVFRIDNSETAHNEDKKDGRESASTSSRPSLGRRSSISFASRIVASRSISQGAMSALLVSGGDGLITNRRDLLSASGLRSGGSIVDLDMHVHPSISRRLLSPILDKNSSSETSATSVVTVENDKMELEPTDAGVLDTDTKLYSWGRGDQSLHDDSDDRISTPDQENKKSHAQTMQVSSRLGSKPIIHSSCATYQSACTTSGGALYVVGKNVHGCVDPNLVEGQSITRPMLLDCIGNIRVVQVSCGYDHTAVLSSNGSVLSWGSNLYGQLGHHFNCNQKDQSTDYQGPTNCSPMGMSLGMGRRASSIACGTNYTLVLTQHMSLLACGIPAIAGHRDRYKWGMPQEIPSLIGLPLVGIAAGDGHASVITAHGTAFIWGENRNGCCARDFPKTMTLPVPLKTPAASPQSSTKSRLMVSDDVAIQHVACGLEHTIFVTRSGDLLVCGSNFRGQLGVKASELQSTSKVLPISHPKGRKFVSAEAGNGHSLILDSAGDVWVTDTNGLKLIIEGKGVLAISAGGDGNCIAVSSDRSGSRSLERQFSMETLEDTKSIVDTVDNLVEEMARGERSKQEIGQEIAKKSEELLRHPPVLNLILNPVKLETIIERILCAGDVATRQTIANAIERGIKSGLESLRGSRMMYPESVRCLLSYIKFFSIRRDEEIVFDVRGEAIFLFCDTILGIPFEGSRALHDFATNLYPRSLFVKMLVRPLLLALNACTKVTTDANEVQHFEPSRQAVPVIVGVLSWLYAMAEEANLAEPSDFYSDGVSEMNVESLFEDLYNMKKASPHEKSKHFFLCANPFLLSPGCKRNVLQMESQVEMFKAMMGNVNYDARLSQIKVEPFYELEIEREHLLEQTLEKIKQADPKDIRKRLKVSFEGEEGLDAGGVTKEFFQLLSEELFDVHSGLWSNKYGDNINWFNTDNTWDENGYEMIGLLVGLALYNSVLLDVHFPLAVYRKILGLPLGLEDIIDEGLQHGLEQLLNYQGDDVEDIFCLTFELTWMEMGEERTLELKPDGANIPVTKENREEYVLRYVRWILVDSVQSQWESFQTGLMRVMEDSSLDLFLPEELELLVVGTPELDFAALEANTKYEGGYNKDSDVVKNFWTFVKDAPPDTQVKLLKFAAASTKAPIGGLGKMDFIIQRAGTDSLNLPTSHTCFNTLLLPDYGSDYEKLKNLLGRAILECEGFGLE